jgi:hypothetical protein
VEQEHLSLSEHLGSPRCLVGLVLLELWFYVYVIQIMITLLVLLTSVIQTNAYNLVRMTRFWINLRQVLSKSKDGDPK